MALAAINKMKRHCYIIIILAFIVCSCEKDPEILTELSGNSQNTNMIYKTYDPPSTLQIDVDPAFSTDTTINLQIDIDNDYINDFQFEIAEGKDYCAAAGFDVQYQYIYFKPLDTLYYLISDYNWSNNGTWFSVNVIYLNKSDTLNNITPDNYFAQWVNNKEDITFYEGCDGMLWSTGEGDHYIPIAKKEANNYYFGWIKFKLTGVYPELSGHAVIELLEHTINTVPNEEIIIGEIK